jgi:hypothetical protein
MNRLSVHEIPFPIVPVDQVKQIGLTPAADDGNVLRAA